MTPSEQRLHPASVLFDLARYARIFLWPALLAYFGSGGGPRIPSRYGVDTSNLEVWLWVLVLPSAALSLVRYLTFRVQYEPDELFRRSCTACSAWWTCASRRGAAVMRPRRA
jgi:hypothetical protein